MTSRVRTPFLFLTEPSLAGGGMVEPESETLFSMRISTSPLSMMKSSEPPSPWRMIASPAA